LGFQKFFKSRYNIIYVIIVFLLLVLGFRMAVLTIVQGEDYRQMADVKKIKDIPVKAPRGKIYDRNGVLLADNITSFTVQMYTDQVKKENFNDVSFILSKILDENGERPIDDFPIELDTFEYINEELEKVEIENTNVQINSNSNTENVANAGITDVESEVILPSYVSSQEKVIQLVKSNLYGWLNYQTIIYDETYNPKNNVINMLKKDIEDLPIDLVDGQYIYIKEDLDKVETDVKEETVKTVESEKSSSLNSNGQPIETDPIKIWLGKNELNVNNNPNQTIIDLLLKENKYMLNLFSNSKIRRLSFEFLKSKNLLNNIQLVEYSFVQDIEYKEIKQSLNSEYEEITTTSNPKDDFVFLTMKYSIDNLLQTVYENDTQTFTPGSVLCDKLKEIYPDLPVEFKVNGEFGTFEFTDDTLKNKYLNQLHLSDKTIAYDFIKELAVKNYDIIYNVITDDDVKYYSQLELLKYENPNISIADWEYTPIRNKRIWISNNLNALDVNAQNYTAKEVFHMLKEKLEIAPDINDYDLRNMLVIRERYNKTSYLSYHPIDICYELSEKTVAMISERSHELLGINVEIEPIRYYPEYSSAAHVLGYLGKIAQDYEVNEYVVEKAIVLMTL